VLTASSFFIRHAYWILFLWVLLEQLGIPLPSTPILLTAGTLTATHHLSLPLVLAAAIAGSLVSDSAWYVLGKRYGGSMVRLLCRLSFESTVCVRKTEEYFAKRGPISLLIAKFVPGLGSVAAPIAGQTEMPYRLFVLYDAAGALLWTLTVVLGGRFFGVVLRQHPNALAWMGHSALALVALLFVALLVWRVVQQRMFMREMRMARIFPDELKAQIDRGEEVFIVDLRHPLDYLPDPRTLPGALLLSPEKLRQQTTLIPKNREVVLFCTCPSEAISAKAALELRKAGVSRVRPLYGGYDEWKKRGYPLVEIVTDMAAGTVQA
jgi:membrane protein DedA with SNARE-associated domain/rhodanese-related sulfurtransferase